jgi:uncharacterized protein YjiS (DUF1127 family)
MNQATATPSLRETFATALTRLIDRIWENSEMRRAAAAADRLGKCSDAQLAELGIQRDQIYYHAFSRYFYV